MLIDPFRAYGSIPTTWNPLDKAAGVVLSNANRTAATPTGTGGVRSTTSKSSGKKYFEISVNASYVVSIDMYAGMSNLVPSLVISPNLGPGGTFRVYRFGGQFYDSAGFAGNVTSALSTSNGAHVMGVAVNFDAGISQWYVDNALFNVAVTYPLAGSSQYIISYDQPAPGGAITIVTRIADMTYAPPSGYSAWDDNAVPPVLLPTWNSADKAALAVLTVNNTIMSNGGVAGTFNGARGVTGHGSGKWYFEIWLNQGYTLAAGANMFIGLGDAASSVITFSTVGGVGSYLGFLAAGNFFYNGGGAGTANPACKTVPGFHVIGVSYDATGGFLTFYCDNLQFGSPFSFSGGPNRYPYAFAQNSPAGSLLLATAASELFYSPPVGFLPWG